LSNKQTAAAVFVTAGAVAVAAVEPLLETMATLLGSVPIAAPVT